MGKVKALGKRKKTKEEKLRERQTRKMALNQADLREEDEEKKLLFLDEGASSDEDAPPVEVSSRKKGKKQPAAAATTEEGGKDDACISFEQWTGEGLREEEGEDEDPEAESPSTPPPPVKKQKRKRKRKTVKEVAEGVFEVEEGEAQFKVVSLESKSAAFPKQKSSFREQLLELSTKGVRSGMRGNLAHMDKWRNVK